MAEGPWEIGSHALTHSNLRELTSESLLDELVTSRIQLSSLTRQPVVSLAYPYGESDRAVEQAARLAGYRMAFAAGPAVDGSRFQLPRHPVRSTDDIGSIRLRTSSWSRRLQPAYRFAPTWARAAIRNTVNTAMERVR
jgi:peptidoglycan/xylan/chitin deacetylase (PgdA/CDA1 family)